MVTQTRVHLQTLVLLIFVVHRSQPVCVDVPSDTDAVVGRSMKLTCISCMKRDEIKAKTTVDWYYMPVEEEENTPPEKTQIYQYKIDTHYDFDGPFKGRLAWNGSQDLQDVSIRIINVTLNDTGVYECHVFREFEFDFFNPSVSVEKEIRLKVKEKVKGLIQTSYFAIYNKGHWRRHSDLL
ncbi:sodium channel subunit beta-3 isoform X2 [Centropristis striata]|uniref:sodium channel subunit beta-3 isoform X2 n=1 Tax=Centropristis striata TaxID=184440 RepID=UPI0027E1DDB6|nr:sodium channel subunit beta-3 isoform X2 [Centropristis striata]